MRPDRLPQRVDRTWRLDVDVDPGVGEGVEQFVHGGDRLAATDPRRGHLPPGQIRDCPDPVGHSVQVLVVEGHQSPVAGRMDIGFQISKPQLDGGPEGREGVFDPDVGRVSGTASMG